MNCWSRLIRFTDQSGTVRFGDAKVDDASEILDLAEKGVLDAWGLIGSNPFNLEFSNEIYRVKKLLGVLTADDVPIIKCVGLNYMKHSEAGISLKVRFQADSIDLVQEGGRKPPPYPSIFVKPRTSLAASDEGIPIPKLSQENQLDYEGELGIVIGKTAKNIPREHALDYIAGYVPANDVSARTWQRDPAFAGGVPQWCFSKGFDKYAPVGPVIVSPRIVGNANNLNLKTSVDGVVRQDSNTNDLLFGVESLVEFISQGSTLEAGTIILTGTPARVAMGMAHPKYLTDGSIVEVRIEKLGSVRNRMVFE